MEEKFFELHTPEVDYKKLTPESIQQWQSNSQVRLALKKTNEQYLHWDELKHKVGWLPEDLFPDKTIFWSWVKVSRMFRSRSTSIRDEKNNYFRMNTDNFAEFLHIIDKEMAGNFMGLPDITDDDKRQLITRNTIEEAIASSQLEGANTSREVAKNMLLEGRKPRSHGERMIVNSHKTMEMIEQKFCKEPLSFELICELHKMITHETIPEGKQGVLRETFDSNGKKLVIKPWDDFTVAYIAPTKEFVEKELRRLIDFANNKIPEKDEFIHPLLKGIMLHFWVGLLHPFEDGNGRLARVLFYWYMLKSEYWAFAYLSISEKIIKSPSQYAMAYVHSEQDDNDLTYFVHYNIIKLKLARKDFQKYLKEKLQENRLLLSSIQQEYDLNERQVKLLQYLNQKKGRRTTLAAHQKLYSVAKATASADLKGLTKLGLIERKRHGRNIFYYSNPETRHLFEL